MNYKDFKGEKISQLGFGLMRLPEKDGQIDREQVEQMIDAAIKGGVNYFDTAWPYHNGTSEIVAGEILKKYPRSSYMIADKYPGHQQFETYNPAEIFELQLKKMGIDYFDFYLMHNVYESSIDVYLDPKWGLLDYFLEQKKNGRIRHLGFSFHGGPDILKRFLDSPWGEHMEFCQIQLNYLDWTLQVGEQKVEILNQHNIPIWVMEGLRGGILAEKGVEKAFRWLQQVPGVTVILSGMSSLQQMQENIDIFSTEGNMTKEEAHELELQASEFADFVPCTACRYCCEECPVGLDIPTLMYSLNDMKIDENTFVPVMYIEALPEDQQPTACLSCGACAQMCPQHIDIPAAMAELAERYGKRKKWSEICKERNEISKKMK